MATKKIHLTLERGKAQLKLKIKIPVEMEKFFKNLSKDGRRQSSKWLDEGSDGIHFYVLNDDYKRMEQRMGHSRVFNDFGETLMRDGDRVNIAPLRAVGASKGIAITCRDFDQITNLDFEFYVKELGLMAKTIWENCIAENKISAVINYEI